MRETTVVFLPPFRERSDLKPQSGWHPLSRSRRPLAYRLPKVVVQYQPYLERLL